MSVKTLRFEPYPADAAEAKMPKSAWTGAIDIPEDSDVRIEALPSKHVIYSGKATDSISRNYQPGKYAYTMEKFMHARQDGVAGRSICTSGTFLVDVTEEQWNKLMFSKPSMVRARQTSEGPRLVCTFPSCGKVSETRMAAFLHEAKIHLGVDPLADPHKAKELEFKAKAVKEQVTAAKAAEQNITDAKIPMA
ncbi:hypothetical protein KAR02_02480 [Candidatus Bipolaricaulota bacterium]|nr:hypothetical protein [Candidatus Bipolaricaulota bacterium]